MFWSIRNASNCCCLAACSNAPAFNAVCAIFCPATLRGSLICCATMSNLELSVPAARTTELETPGSDGVCDDARSDVIDLNNPHNDKYKTF